MDSFKIVITRARKPTYWYADLIGEEFEVVGVDRMIIHPSRFLVNNNGNIDCYTVEWCDCELTKEE